MQEIHRFPNDPIMDGGTLRWRFDDLLQNILRGLGEGSSRARAAGSPAQTLGIDTWGVDYGLLNANGDLIETPVHYRDARTNDMMEKVFREEVPADEIFAETGIQFMQLNTIFQLVAARRGDSAKLSGAHRLLLMGDLFHHALSGAVRAEFTNATTTQLCNPRTRDWAWPLIERLQLPRHLFAPIAEPGTRLGPLRQEIADRTGLHGTELIAVGTHDTASAVAAVPATGPDFAYISCGTWSLIGTEVREPVINSEARALNFTNEGGVFGTFRLLKNVMGLWLLQESERQWERDGQAHTWDQLIALAEGATPLVSLINPDESIYFPPGDMPGRIRARCAETGQPPPADHGAIARCILESLALAFRDRLRSLAKLCGRKLSVLHIVGGGARNRLLCQFTADACGVPVHAGPVEATALGNIGMQLAASGRISGLEELRATIARSEQPTIYSPRPTPAWEDAERRFAALTQSR